MRNDLITEMKISDINAKNLANRIAGSFVEALGNIFRDMILSKERSYENPDDGSLCLYEYTRREIESFVKNGEMGEVLLANLSSFINDMLELIFCDMIENLPSSKIVSNVRKTINEVSF